MRPQRYWTAEEREIAWAMHANRAPLNDIADRLGRTKRSVKSAIYQRRTSTPRKEGLLSQSYDGPAIGRDPAYAKFIRNAIEGSARLRDAIRRMG